MKILVVLRGPIWNLWLLAFYIVLESVCVVLLNLEACLTCGSFENTLGLKFRGLEHADSPHAYAMSSASVNQRSKMWNVGLFAYQHICPSLWLLLVQEF